MNEIKKIVLAYSGGLDTSVIIPWLKEHYVGAEVIAACADVGQPDDFPAIEKKAYASGAAKVYIMDLKKEFLDEYVWPTIQAGAVYEGKYLLGTSFARPLISKKLVEVAKAEGADAICHGATGKGNDQVRFELTVKALAPEMKLIAPWRMWELKSREDELKYAEAHNVPIDYQSEENPYPYSMDWNIWHLSHEGDDLENPANAPKDMVYMVTTPPEKAPDTPAYIELTFKAGKPVALDGKAMDSLELMQAVNEVGAKNGIGIVDIVENRLVGMKSRGIYENPGGAILMYAHRE